MPLYEFRCPEGHDFEKFYRSIGAAPSEEKCPVCGAPAVRLMSAAGLVFKGSGFYITDYGKDGKKAERDAATARDTAASGAKTADAPSTEAKPADGAARAPDGGAKPAEAKASPAPEKPVSTGTAKASAGSAASKKKAE